MKQVPFILEYLHNYTSVLQKLDLTNLIKPYELKKHHADWKRLCAQYGGLEKGFFKPYWVPLKQNDYDLFLDASDPNYPLFKVDFISAEPYQYVKQIMFNSVSELMLLDDLNIDIETLKEQFDDDCLSFISMHYEKRSKSK